MQSLGWEGPLEKEMATHSSILVLGNPMDGGAWRAIVHGVAKEWDTTSRLSDNNTVNKMSLSFVSCSSKLTEREKEVVGLYIQSVRNLDNSPPIWCWEVGHIQSCRVESLICGIWR